MASRFPLTLVFLCLLAGCTAPHSAPKTGSPKASSEVCGLDFQWGFHKTHVVAYFDGKRVVDQRLTTPVEFALASGDSFPTHGRFLRLRIEEPAGRVVLEQTIDLRKGRFLGITRNLTTHQYLVNQEKKDFHYN